MLRSLVLSLFFLVGTTVLAQSLHPLTKLAQLQGVTVTEVPEANTEGRTFRLMVRQPLDHDNPAAGYFDQKVYVTHAGYDHLTTIITEGYSRPSPRIYELTSLLDANQVQVEHRYFGESMPDSVDYRYLNLEQAAADLHRIRTLLAGVYPGQWVSTGISKGGATTIFYRYFYPDDVTVSVPYVAPINRAYEEPRLYTFLDTIGTDACRADIAAFQRRVLTQRETMLPLLRFYALGAGLKFNYVSLEEAFEYAVLEYPFSFWQYGRDCSAIPGPAADPETLLKYLLDVSGVTFFSDGPNDAYRSHYYQSATEMGYYGYRTAPFKDLLTALPTDRNPMALFFPEPLTEPFDGELLRRVNDWLEGKTAQRIAYINGAIDTWSASGVPENDRVDSEWFVLPNKHHGTARIKQMDATTRARFVSTLERWLGVDLE